MAVSKLQPLGGANNFTLDVGNSGNTTYVLTKEYSPGAYSITSQLSDSTLDVYVFNSDGTLSGYTNTKALTATSGFTKVVVLGATINDLLSFEYKTTYSPASKGSDVLSGPFLTSVSPTSAPSVDSTFTITGGNFATNATVKIVGTDAVIRNAKSVTRSSSTQLMVTRPDSMPIEYSPYSIIVNNPDSPTPSGSNVNILSNSITAGTNPVWQTPTTLPYYTYNVPYSTTIVAQDTEASTMQYSIVAGNLPAGLSLSTSGEISGIATVGTKATFTARATDAGGNYVDRVFTIPNYSLSWTTTAGPLPTATLNSAYSYQLQTTDDYSGISYSLVSGSMPTGLSVSSSGLISGTPTAVNGGASFTIRATDLAENYVDRTFSISIYLTQSYTASGTFTVPAGNSTIDFLVIAGGGSGSGYNSSNVAGSGGGAGGVIEVSAYSVTPGQQLSMVVGAGASGQQSTGDSSSGYRGGNSSFAGYTAIGGGGGVQWNDPQGQSSGGSGGGASGNVGPGSGTSGQGNSGYRTGSQYSGGGGGGKAAAATSGVGGAGMLWSGTYYGGGGGGCNGGSSDYTSFAGGIGGGGRGGNPNNSTVPTPGTDGLGGGGGGCGSSSGETYRGARGGNGAIVVRYKG